MRIGRLLATTIAIAMAAAVAAPPGHASYAGPVIGIGEQKPGMFQSAPWQRLGLRDARYTAPWDALEDPAQLALLDAWMAAARRAHVRVLLGFAHSLRTEKLARTLPKPRQYARQFRRFRDRYPWVHEYVVWNEANHPGALTAKRPGRAAQFFDAAARICPRCQLVAADVLDTPNMANWVERFVRAAHRRPKIWGLHNYGDANGLKVKSTPRLLALTRGRIWFTETGGVVLRRVYNGRRVVRTYRYSLRHAALSTAHALQLSCLSPRITRVYLYHWQPPPKVTNWDSGLLNGAGRPRPAYGVVRRWLQRGAWAARHGGRRSLCQ